MREKRKYTRLCDLDAFEIVMMYHLGKATQASLEKRFGLARGYVNKLVHGETRPAIYAAVKESLALHASAKQ